MSLILWTPAYIGIGSNLDTPETQVLRGFEALRTIPQTESIARSKLYRTVPFGPQDQPHYVNAVAGLLTQLDAATLLAHLKALETQLGRERPVVRWGPRVIDFDLLMLGAERIQTDALKVPHPGVAERASVLVPWMDVAPDAEVPGVGSVRALLAGVDSTTVQAL